MTACTPLLSRCWSGMRPLPARATLTGPRHSPNSSNGLPVCRMCRHRVKPSRPSRCMHTTRATASETVEAVTATAAAAAAAVADPASASTAVVAATSTSTPDTGFLAPLTNGLESVLKSIQVGLDTVHVPYSYGWSIILLVAFVKILTYPLTKQQVESTLAMQSLKPRIERIKKIYGEDKAKVQRETSIMYEEAGVNPLAGCLPTLFTIPIFIGLYRSLTNVASEGLLDTQGFYWVPSLAGPTTVAARQAGAGTAWLFPFVDGHPPIGWDQAAPYLVLPVLLVVAQYISSAIISPPLDPNDENYRTQLLLIKGLPLMIGWFSLNVPSGLSLYYFSNTVLTSVQQIYLRKLGGATVDIKDLGPVTKLGAGRRMGAPVTETPWVPSYVAAAMAAAEEAEAAAQAAEAAEAAGVSGEEVLPAASPAVATPPQPEAEAAVLPPTPVVLNRRCRRRSARAAAHSGPKPALQEA